MAAASYSVVMTCKNCGRGSITISKTVEATGATADAVRNNRFARCTICGYPVKAKLASIVVNHTAAVGSNTTITHTITNGSPASAVS